MRLVLCFSVLVLCACGGQQPTGPPSFSGDATPTWGPSGGDPVVGKQLAIQYCITCHQVDGQGVVFPGAPPFEVTAARKDIDVAFLSGWLDNPLVMKERTLMPDLGLKPDQIENLIAYLYTLRPDQPPSE